MANPAGPPEADSTGRRAPRYGDRFRRQLAMIQYVDVSRFRRRCDDCEEMG